MRPISVLPSLTATDPACARWGRGLDCSMLLAVGAEEWLLRVRDGVVAEARPGPFVMRSFDVALRITPEAWAAFLAPEPEPGWHDLMGLRRKGLLHVEGDLALFFAHLGWFKAALALLREATATPRPAPAPRMGWEPIQGGYLHLEIAGRPHRVYVEQAGEGIPLLLLHTAGSDGRQYRDLMNDPEVTSRFRCVAFDMPWHGKSSPPAGWQQEEYRLTTAGYTGMVMAVSRAMGLEKPIVIGCSIGGRIVLDLAAEHGAELRGVVGLQSGAFLSPYYDISYLHHPRVHGGEVCSNVVSGLVSPQSPEQGRWETLWHYMQGGPGVFKGDLHFYKTDGDLRHKLGRIDTSICPVTLLTGDYDYSCTAEDTRATAAAIPGALATVMHGLGHFPMSEDYATLRGYLLPALDAIAARG